MVRVGRYPLHHGTVGAIRSLGRLGVDVHAIVEDRLTPAAVSRHLNGRWVWPTDGDEDPAVLVEGLSAIARRVRERTGRAPLAIPTDDEAAVLLAERADAFAGLLTLPPVAPGLPRALSSKSGLAALCREHGVDTPGSLAPRSWGELDAVLTGAAGLRFPLVAKNDVPYSRLSRPAVGATTLLPDADALRALAAGWRAGPAGPRAGADALPHVLLQEYLPRQEAEDWIAHLYCPGDRSAEGVVFTGVKVRSWPAGAGVTAHAYSVANPELAELSRRFCAAIGFRGIADLDWRLDRRDGRHKLLDFNPRVGAQFRLFETYAGVDVVRALHLDLSGRPIPPADPVEGRRFTVEILDGPARLAARRGHSSAQLPAAAPAPAVDVPPARLRELAWAAADDPLPALAATVRSAGPVAHRARALARRAGRALLRRRDGA